MSFIEAVLHRTFSLPSPFLQFLYGTSFPNDPHKHQLIALKIELLFPFNVHSSCFFLREIPPISMTPSFLHTMPVQETKSFSFCTSFFLCQSYTIESPVILSLKSPRITFQHIRDTYISIRQKQKVFLTREAFFLLNGFCMLGCVASTLHA